MSDKRSLEEAVQHVLGEQAARVMSAPHAPITSPPARRRVNLRPTLAATLASIGVMAVIAAAAYATVNLVSTDHTSRSNPTSAASLPTKSPRQPEDIQYVSFHGIELAVPAGWLLYAERCSTARTDTVLLQGVHTDCRTNTSEAHVTVVRLATSNFEDPATLRLATSPVVLNGQRLQLGHRRLADGRYQTIAVFPAVDVVVEIASPSGSQAQAILASARTVAADHAGCLSRYRTTGAAGAHDGLRELGSTTPVHIALCSYIDGWLYASSTRASGSAVTTLTRILSALKPGYTSAPGFTENSAGCARHANSTDGYVLHFDFTDGHSLTLDVRLSMCGPMYVTDGADHVQISEELLMLLPTLAPYDANLPPFHQLVQHPA
jgi:hypothetical protein